MSTKRRFIIVALIAGVLFISIFVAFQLQQPTHQGRVYELPDSRIRVSVAEQVGPSQQAWLSDGNAVPQRNPSTDDTQVVDSGNGGDDLGAIGKNEVEPCCPDEADRYPAADIEDFGQDPNLDNNPVSPELIKDTKLYWEYVEERNKYNERYDALREKQRQLERELVSLDPVLVERMQEAYPGIKFQSHLTQEARLAKLEALGPKMESLIIELKELEQQRPVAPISTHRH